MSQPNACLICGGDRMLRWLMMWAWLAWVADADNRIVLCMQEGARGCVENVMVYRRADRMSLLDPGPWIRVREYRGPVGQA